ncbi:response regulator transcription factor [Methylacidimicrobium tartarophylax]|uniref:Transcriptional regulatory protein BasR n=1 Tax=Methylacidimicrobium tartarophylax TaxID=1041768 RepID=A0A5E6MBN6_9BACT|nr:response regulator transcription factor [Methylacidimicrobium tartarophylax]VVM05724.1 Transcriptional regulatory protein BasR [Methylacidimicrobium tartarophylax]
MTESKGGVAADRWGGSTAAILIVERQARRARAMQQSLSQHHYRCVVTRTTEEAFFQLATESFDLVIIGSEPVGRSGKKLLEVLQGRHRDLAKLVLGPRDSSTHAIQALAHGADDVASLDLSEAELVARVTALLRRNAEKTGLRKTIGELTMDIGARRVWLRTREIPLTSKEFELLLYLIQHVKEVVTPEMLARDVWREPNRVSPLQSVIYVHLSNLRRKLRHDQELDPIRTIRGVGYQLDDAIFLLPLG